ncbi:ras GTPase-activating-like protein IQGAP1 [Camponotus floridanus]|uniref:ras GTPase-activating-like protein IQGAP1 n=1 Tax=Camponotus floridanus TaxID=104421 RepID=UPI00059BEADB|nr:ras GTPase-activating-like protein IQGAP1 [Camponotus floridanus]XP_025264686.1 ras GTPase-activating-like protein IQGAP1 [Camponotus floridanus]
MIDAADVSTEDGKEEDVGKSVEKIDEQRRKTLAYEYLCYLEGAKKWMEACLRESLPPTTELEENLRNGVYLAKLAHFIAPNVLSLNKIYDIEQRRYKAVGLQFRHTDNINHFLKCLASMQLPLTFLPETTDIYDKKNMPRVIYCLHALSTHLFKLGKAPPMQDLYGKVNFSDEEIDAVSKELQKYGIQLPPFQKIGGLLTNSIATDTAALHAAVIAINQVLIDNDNDKVLYTLQSAEAQLNNIKPVYIKEYIEALLAAKIAKTETSLNRSLNDSYVADVYDELLTQAEIQGHINYVNASCALKVIISSVLHNDADLIAALRALVLPFKNIASENVEDYKEQLMLVLREEPCNDICASENIQYWMDTFQSAIDKGNENAQRRRKRENTVKLLNMALESADQEKFYEILQSPYLEISHYIDEYAFPLYYQEMKDDRIESHTDLTYNDIVTSVRLLPLIAAITKAVDMENPDFVYEKLSNPDVYLPGLDEFNKIKYAQTLATLRQVKLKTFQECSLLTYSDIQQCIYSVNTECDEDFEVIKILQQINQAVAANDHETMMRALEMITDKCNIPKFSHDPFLCLNRLKKRLIEKKSDGSELWLDDIETVAKTVASEMEQIENMTKFLYNINTYVQDDNMTEALECCKNFDGIKNFKDLSKEYQKRCFLALQQLQKRKHNMYNCPYTTNEKNEILKDKNYACYYPADIKKIHHLTINDINETIESIIMETGQKNYTAYDEKLFIRLQAGIRGYLLRKKIVDRYAYINDNIRSIIMIQAWWRGIRQRKQYHKLLKEKELNALHHNQLLSAKTNHKNNKLHQNKLSNIKENNKNDKLNRYKKQEDKIIKIQALWRGRASRKAFHSLLRSEKPSFPVVRHFSTVLGFSAEDYDKDLELQKLKHEVVQCIRHNQNLSEHLNNMYIKIGLLIQNRIALQDVVAHGKSLDTLAKEQNVNKNQNTCDPAATPQKGLKSLTKEGRKMLEGYQHLFYALQTNPQYLSKLLYLPPSNKSNKLFLKNIIWTLFNFGSNTREDYLLLKLFGYALKEEIKCNCHQPSDVLTGKPLVREMVVNYAKQFNGQASLKQIVGPLIEKVLEEKDLCMETNPVDIYKLWRNQLEMESGKSLDMPHTVSQEQALKHIPVQELLTRAINQLKKISLEFLNRITKSRDLIPYGMLYVSKILYGSLMEKFPFAPEKDILKAVGNLIYYHFINAAIVAPDTFDIVTLPVDRSLSSCQRKNLASIAKVLQFSTSKKGFGEEAPHLECLNPFIIACHEKFKDFFRYCCQVEDLEDHFNIHEYTEATLIQSPEICVSLQEICEIHALMLRYEDMIAPDPSDSLHDLLDDLGPVPTVASLLGISNAVYETNLARYSKQEVCLVLTNKFQVPRNDDTNLNNLFVKTKELLVSVISFLKKSTLIESLEITSSPMCARFDHSSMSATFRESSSINDCKMQLRAYLNKLELEGWVTRADGYQTIVTAIARDICNKNKYRVARDKELQTLRATKMRLDEKTRYYQEQVEFYNEYIRGCLQNLHRGKSSLRAYRAMQKDTHTLSKLRTKMMVKYSAWKLQEKGVLMEIDQTLSPTEMKNVIFEISPTERNGVFSVRCKFMGVEMEKLDISIQELLELQYEGRSCMDMFGRAKVNVNLLLYLLNRKFYGKKN